MPLNSSGQLSLAGTNVGQSIALELGLGASSNISLNDAVVRSFAQRPSGSISLPSDFWGRSNITMPTAIEYLVIAGGAGGTLGSSLPNFDTFGVAGGAGGRLAGSLTLTPADSTLTVLVGSGGVFTNHNGLKTSTVAGDTSISGGAGALVTGLVGGSSMGTSNKSTVNNTFIVGQGNGSDGWAGGGGGAGGRGLKGVLAANPNGLGGNGYFGDGGYGGLGVLEVDGITRAGGGACYVPARAALPIHGGGVNTNLALQYAVTALNALPNSGSGGSGGKPYKTSWFGLYAGAASSGGSGVAIIRYPNTFSAAASTLGNPVYSNTGGFHQYVFNTSGSLTF